MTQKPLVSAVINVRNEAETLPKCLKSLSGFADEIIVIDMHSTDNSAQIAKDSGAQVYSYRPLDVVEPARNFALSKASGKWIILLDPDEYLGNTLKKELLRLTQRGDIDCVKIPRKNFILGKWIRHSNFWPDYLVRFFRKGTVTWNKAIHSQPTIKGNCHTLLDSEKLAIRHQNYQSITQFILRNLRYTDIQSEELLASGYKFKISDFILRPVQEFNSRFFAAEGYRDGLHGLVLAILQTISIALVYIRLWEKQGSEEKNLPKDSLVSAVMETDYEFGYWFSRYFTQEYNPNPFKKLVIKLRLIFLRLTKNF